MLSKLKDLFQPANDEQLLDFFQLEGLIRNQVPFLLLDLREKNLPVLSDKAQKLVKGSEAVGPKEVEAYLKDKQVSEIQPIVLVCAKGKSSRRLARELQKKSWLNVYALAGGFEQLEKDLLGTK